MVWGPLLVYITRYQNLAWWAAAQNGYFGHYLENGKRYDPENMLTPVNAVIPLPMKLVNSGSLSSQIPKYTN